VLFGRCVPPFLRNQVHQSAEKKLITASSSSEILSTYLQNNAMSLARRPNSTELAKSLKKFRISKYDPRFKEIVLCYTVSRFIGEVLL
jgi:hypothetical protein